MPKATREAAEAEFERLASAADVNIDPDTMNDEEVEELEELSNLFVGAIADGAISIDEEGRAVLHTKDGDPMVFRVPLGADLMIMASAREEKRMEAMSRFVSALTGQPTARLDKLRKKEWKLAMRIAGFLSAD